MSLIRCPECGKENVSDSAQACPSCGYGIKEYYEKIRLEEIEKGKIEVEREEDEKHNFVSLSEQDEAPKITRKKLYLLIIVAIVFIIASVVATIFLNAKEKEKKLNEIEALVQAGNYLEAWENIDKDILESYNDEEFVDKAMVIGYMEYMYEDAKKSSANISDTYLLVVLKSIGAHQKLLDWGLYDYIEKMVLDSIQQIENRRDKIFDDTVEEMIYEEYNDLENTIVEPYRTENPNGAKEYIQYLISSIDGTKTEQYAKEQYDKNNPLQITEKSANKDDGYWYCTGTLSNVSSKIYYYVKIKVTYYDKNMNVLTTDWTYAVDSVGIAGGENQLFEIMTKVTGNVEKFKVEVLEYQ